MGGFYAPRHLCLRLTRFIYKECKTKQEEFGFWALGWGFGFWVHAQIELNAAGA